MAQIDAYNYSLLGFVECPSSHDFICKSNSRYIAVYRLEEDAEEFDAKEGDILVGGGRGEADALRIAMPEMTHWMNDELEKVEKPEVIIHPFWSPTYSFMIGGGFNKVGWKPAEKRLEVWLAEKTMNDVVLKPTPFKAFQEHLATFYPQAVITESFTLGGKYELRFELGGIAKNATKKRIKQATDRACELFRAHFSDIEASIWVLAYQELNPYFDGTLNQYLPSILKGSILECYEEVGLPCHSRFFEDDEDGNSIPQYYNAKIIVAKVKLKNLPLEQLLSGVSSFEMGKQPCIPQEVYFFQGNSDKAFRMYDDRGCYVWANKANKIKPFFIKFKNWIPEYHLEEVEGQFSSKKKSE